MRVLLGGFGTRGDVQPMLALGLALRAAGHSVTMCAPPDFAQWTAELGLPYRPVGESMQSLMERVGDRDGNLSITAAFRELPRLLIDQFRAMEPLAQEADAIVASSLSCAGASLAEKRGIPYRSVCFSASAIPSSAHPSPFVKRQTLPRALNRISWWINFRAWTLLFRRAVNAERARLGLPPIRDVWAHLLWQRLIVASEPSIYALPPETPPEVAQTGAWFMPEQEELDPAIDAFLRAGPPPVYIGFGSMPDKDPAETSRRVIEAVQAAGVRALLSRGWAGLGKVDLPPTAMVIGPTPHGKLFPRVAAVIHHGGAGTTAAAARAGAPQVLVPHVLDQFFWCHRMRELGLSPPPIPKGRLSAAALAAALRTCMEDQALRDRARAFAAGIIPDGVQRAVRLIEETKAAA